MLLFKRYLAVKFGQKPPFCPSVNHRAERGKIFGDLMNFKKNSGCSYKVQMDIARSYQTFYLAQTSSKAESATLSLLTPPKNGFPSVARRFFLETFLIPVRHPRICIERHYVVAIMYSTQESRATRR